MYKALGIVGHRNLMVAGMHLEVIGLTLSISDLIFIVFMIDRVGRRKPLLWGTVGITLALIAEAIVNSQINKEAPQHGLSYAGVAFLFCVSVIFSCRF
jgi:predicted tellurium resistance membrane protein TerC